MNLLKKIQENIFHQNILARGSKIVVGVSGGPDSVCLIHLLNKLRSKYALKLVVAHVNYGLRGKDSDLDEKLTRNIAEELDLPIEIKRVKNISKLMKPNENTLRDVRYDFFERTRKKHHADCIAVGHNLSDQAETVLMRILRGSGLQGLSAIKFRNKYIIRPILNITRSDILDFLKGNKIPLRIDKSNLSMDYTRNRIRNKLIPQLQKDFNPNIESSIFSLASTISDDYEFIERYSRKWLEQHPRFSIKKLLELHPAIQRTVLRISISKNNSGLKEVESSHIEEILKVARSNKNKVQKLYFKGLKITKRGDKLDISRNLKS